MVHKNQRKKLDEFNEAAMNLPAVFGITPERFAKIVDIIQSLYKKHPSKSKVIITIWNDDSLSNEEVIMMLYLFSGACEVSGEVGKKVASFFTGGKHD